MFDRIQRSFDLVGASARVLRQDKHLLLFPIVSGVALLLVLATFALPMIGFASFDAIGRRGLYSVGFLFYIVQYFVIFYFNAALVGAVMIRLDGNAPTLGDGLRIANGRIGTIFGYAVIAATVGVILRAIEERAGFVGRLVAGLLGAGWSLASYLAVPVIVTRDRGPLDSIAESANLFKRTWGENVIGNAGIGIAFSFVYFVLILVTTGLAVVVPSIGGMAGQALFLLSVAAIVLAFLACILLHATLGGIYAAVLYRYAVDGDDALGFGGDVLGGAFRQKA